MQMGQREPYRILLAPFPLTVLAAYGYYLLSRLGLVCDQTLIFFDWHPARRAPKAELDPAKVLHLYGKGQVFQKFLDGVISELSNNQKLLRRYLAFCISPMKLNLPDFVTFTRIMNRNVCDPKPALEEAAQQFSRWLTSGMDPFTNGVKCSLSLPDPQNIKDPDSWLAPSRLSSTFVPIPSFRDTKPTTRTIIGAEDVRFDEGRINLLSGKRLAVLIGGPPKSGKSTACASLVHRMESIIKSLATRRGWSTFGVSVRYVNLDLATPTVEAIHEQGRANAKALLKLKIPWTSELAEEALNRAVGTRQKYNIVIGDLPGGTPDEITAWISTIGDAAIILTRDWKKIEEWRRFFKSMGIDSIAEALTLSGSRKRDSLVRSYRRGKFISARISGLELVVSPWNRVIEFTANTLLFDILPSIIERRKRQVEAFLEKISRK